MNEQMECFFKIVWAIQRVHSLAIVSHQTIQKDASKISFNVVSALLPSKLKFLRDDFYICT